MGFTFPREATHAGGNRQRLPPLFIHHDLRKEAMG